MKIVVSVDRNWAIGKDNKLLVRIPSDMQQFRNLTIGNVVIMGRKTFDSLPNHEPLEGRKNIILTRDENYTARGVEVAHSVDELMDMIADVDTDSVFVIGGATIYEQLLDKCDEAIITYIDYEYQADTFFPNLEEREEWELVEESDEKTYFDLEYYFRTYKRKAK